MTDSAADDQPLALLEHTHDIDPLYHGSGLGLRLIRLIVREAPGTVTFAENDPRESVVTLRLPVATNGALARPLDPRDRRDHDDRRVGFDVDRQRT